MFAHFMDSLMDFISGVSPKLSDRVRVSDCNKIITNTTLELSSGIIYTYLHIVNLFLLEKFPMSNIRVHTLQNIESMNKTPVVGHLLPPDGLLPMAHNKSTTILVCCVLVHFLTSIISRTHWNRNQKPPPSTSNKLVYG